MRILGRIAEAASADPDGTARDVVFPVTSLDTLSAIIRAYKAAGAFERRVVEFSFCHVLNFELAPRPKRSRGGEFICRTRAYATGSAILHRC